MMEHCVTQKLWNIVMRDNPSAFKGDNRPVSNVTYYDCLNFINMLNNRLSTNFRLPSEAEWEYAARGGNLTKEQTKYSGGNTLDEIAWYNENSNNVTHDVMRKKPNVLGIYDMSGNVWEWCASRNKPYVPRNNYRQKKYYINRGGCATSTAKGCRTSRRYYSHPNHSSCYLGFRLVL